MTVAQVIANNLNIRLENIIDIQEWANVLFVVIKGVGGRFVSKSSVIFSRPSKPKAKKRLYPNEAIQVLQEKLCGSHWFADKDHCRLYFSDNSCLIAKSGQAVRYSTYNKTARMSWQASHVTPEHINNIVRLFNSKFQVVGNISENELNSRQIDFFDFVVYP